MEQAIFKCRYCGKGVTLTCNCQKDTSIWNKNERENKKNQKNEKEKL